MLLSLVRISTAGAHFNAGPVPHPPPPPLHTRALTPKFQGGLHNPPLANMSIFTHQRLNVDFSPADAVAVTPALTLAGVFASMGSAYVAALQPAGAPLPANHPPRSYCELTAASCASATVNYDSLLPVPSNHCGGCRKVQLAGDVSPAWRTAAAAPAPGVFPSHA